MLVHCYPVVLAAATAVARPFRRTVHRAVGSGARKPHHGAATIARPAVIGEVCRRVAGALPAGLGALAPAAVGAALAGLAGAGLGPMGGGGSLPAGNPTRSEVVSETGSGLDAGGPAGLVQGRDERRGGLAERLIQAAVLLEERPKRRGRAQAQRHGVLGDPLALLEHGLVAADHDQAVGRVGLQHQPAVAGHGVDDVHQQRLWHREPGPADQRVDDLVVQAVDALIARGVVGTPPPRAHSSSSASAGKEA